MQAYEEFRRSRHLGGLDGLRALAIGAVVAHHVGLGGVAGRGILGVTTFFAISGFLVTTILLREQDATGTLSLRSFHVRRVLRIWPLYFAALALYVVLVLALERDTPEGARFFENLPYFLTFTANWGIDRMGDGRTIFVFAWSLASLEQFYLVWPSLLRLGRGTSLAVAASILLLVAEQAAHHATALGIDPNAPVVRVLTGGAWSPICLGALLAFVLHRRRGFRLVSRVAGRPWSVPAAALLVLAGASLDAIPTALFCLFVAYLVAACVLGGSTACRRVLDVPALVHVGKVSYGIYLLHMLAVGAVRTIVPAESHLAVFVLALPSSVAVATASYHLFESRFLALRQRLAGPPRPPSCVGGAVLPCSGVRE